MKVYSISRYTIYYYTLGTYVRLYNCVSAHLIQFDTADKHERTSARIQSFVETNGVCRHETQRINRTL